MQETTNHSLARYVRQTIFSGLGEAGQRRLLAARVVIIGCGATGTVMANHLARAGVGHLRVVDRDYIELNNLQRQLLFDEEDMRQGLPKAAAAAAKLRRINSEIEIEAVVADVNPGNVVQLVQDVDLVMDGADNFETRYLLNDACVKLGKPWIYTGVIGSYGVSQTIVPGQSACLRCVMGQMPAPGATPTCDTAGVLGPAVAVVASISAGEALKRLGQFGEPNRGMLHYDLWDNSLEVFDLGGPRADCPACGQHDYEFLNAMRGTHSITLCGRNAVQISVNRGAEEAAVLNLARLAQVLQPLGAVRVNAYLLKADIDGYLLTIFPDGRAIIAGTSDPDVARTLYAKYVGN
ncbi:ThiF family adenylyltransferase [Candidatus Amarolinea aalborgensis]|jgi:adenylyltransferase/sulfurtransferase|uniref:ThiF family adenylyltransferase n=1 Tax=Candidatus Amarolinea aalborgensis TaxID=2249329 RepID=UPI003BF9B54C